MKQTNVEINTTKGLNKAMKHFVFVLLTIISLTLTGCEGGSGLDYSDFDEEHLNSWKFVLTQEEDSYLVYYYGVNCSHCITIKDELLSFALENDAEIMVYFIDSAVVGDYELYPILDPITGKDVEGTPTIIVVNDGVAVDFNVGASVIRDLMNQINEGSYGLIR